MPNIKGAAKRMRQAERARQKNVAVRSKIKHVRRQVLAAGAPTAPEAAPAVMDPAVFKKYCSLLDKAAKAGVIKKNTAIRRKRRAAERLRQASAAKA